MTPEDLIQSLPPLSAPSPQPTQQAAFPSDQLARQASPPVLSVKRDEWQALSQEAQAKLEQIAATQQAAPAVQAREKTYDDAIAPKLLEIAQLCREAGMQFVAVVEYETNSVGRTEQSNLDEAGPQFRLAAYGARCNGNADALIAALLKDDEKHAHGQSKSFYLHRLAREKKE